MFEEGSGMDEGKNKKNWTLFSDNYFQPLPDIFLASDVENLPDLLIVSLLK